MIIEFLRNLFRKNKPAFDENDPLAPHRKVLESCRLPGIFLRETKAACCSKLGGMPDLPSDVEWPRWNDKPLAFLCQIALGELPDEWSSPALPPAGMLFFFYDQDQSTWGFDPKDAGSRRVIYSDASADSRETRAAPEGLDPACIYHEARLELVLVDTYPDWQDERIEALDFDDHQIDAYVDLCDSVFGEAPMHHLFGHPQPIQTNDMDLECQLAASGVYCGDASGFQSERAMELAEFRDDWVLLLQLDSDDHAEMMWGDAGMLYFWIRKQDLAAGDFDNVWMILQCS